jgi:4-amino-4-deoxy-L-arabinose transferase-like glycosyltransferase
MFRRIPPYGTALALLFAAALALRVAGTSYGLPLLVNSDEMPIASHAVGILATGDPNPGFFHYPSLYIYMQAGLDAALYGAGRATGKYTVLTDLDGRLMIRAGRIMTAVLGALTVLAAYLVGRALWGRPEGLAAAALLAVSPLHVAHSFHLAVDVPTGLFAALALWPAARRLSAVPRWGDYLGAAACAGLAAGTKYTAAFAILPLIVAHFLGPWPGRPGRMRRAADPRLLAAVVLVPVVFLATTPYAVLDREAFARDVAWEGHHYAKGHAGAEAGGAWSLGAYLRLLEDDLGPEGLVLVALGAALLLWRDPRALAVVLAFPAFYLLFIGRFPVYFPRNLAPVVPALALVAGAGLVGPIRAAAAAPRGERRRAILVAVAVAVGALGAAGFARHTAQSVAYVRTVTLPDTRWAALRWVSLHVPAGSRVVREPHTPEVELLETDGRPRLTVEALTWSVADMDPKAVMGFDYVVLSAAMYARFVDQPQRYPVEAGRYRALFDGLSLEAEFRPKPGRTTGPVIRIYRVPHGPGPPGGSGAASPPESPGPAAAP